MLQASSAGSPAPAKALSLPAALIHSKHPRLLLHEFHLLAQLLYKSHAQLRSAKWVQSVRALRKCGKRIFGEVADDEDRSKKRRRIDDKKEGSSSGKNTARQSKAEILTGGGGGGGGGGGVFGKVQIRANAIALAPDKNASNAGDSSTSSTPATAGIIRLRPAEIPANAAIWQRLPRQGRHGSGGDKGGDLRASVDDLVSLLRHLVERCNTSYAVISAHLRTPPAPTFAPLATALLGICAQCGSTATSWADDLERIDWNAVRN
ncbi:hypothetical protein A4X13_0g6040 [Tilletia indica]|uniref:Uncharacterized protein n=1 Tax=Tilletia indica TaxID=43049 RepID=A0A177TI74_9BASI|nr:hypothetical protein A4X13_0g6040 [Tilletia indica]